MGGRSAMVRSMGYFRPSLQRCVGRLTNAGDLSVRPYRSNGLLGAAGDLGLLHSKVKRC
jgi:hypothetical protein